MHAVVLTAARNDSRCILACQLIQAGLQIGLFTRVEVEMVIGSR